MNRLERALGILLVLRASKSVTAKELAGRFEVSTRTIYRDVEMLSAVGVPVYAEVGRDGGLRLTKGYFLPPVMFTIGEAVSLLLGLVSLRRFRAKPFADELETAAQKLRAAVPDTLRDTLTRVQEIVGFEEIPQDIFSLERIELSTASEKTASVESEVLKVFVQAILSKRQIRMSYVSPYRGVQEERVLVPQGMFWDRDYWYLVATPAGKKAKARLWRADRVAKMELDVPLRDKPGAFDIADWMGRQWLNEAMKEWAMDSPVRLHVTLAMAERLQQDWYYRHAQYRETAGGKIEMTFGEDKRERVMELVRWLGPGAELIEPIEWREALRKELEMMAAAYK